ncbi:hypothetical protein SPBR_07764 [Sporothrix brasiliensis 5110]|uniref:Pre-mRNA splicing factor ini1 n=1 Tax=Sporothrix brasiliensis 5110 TaxID=1398154 RepID=A0A0C2EPK3_9PEZI|nr:uncharacterized protein SPBR_07764 [Sporothrix brasiliensis 5110]KIH88144.1 hypothetical protein SPBR_07764 [Sporothrix brasiliensis 5110]
MGSSCPTTAWRRAWANCDTAGATDSQCLAWPGLVGLECAGNALKGEPAQRQPPQKWLEGAVAKDEKSTKAGADQQHDFAAPARFDNNLSGLDDIQWPLLTCPKATPLSAMSRHHPDLVMCRKQPGIAVGRVCDKCDGKCPVCDSYVRPTTLVRICDECSFGNYMNKCVVCSGEGISDAFYCFECTRLEKDRDGCPKIINLGSSRTDLFYQKKTNRSQY